MVAEGAEGRVITLEEASKHTTEKDAWLVIHGKVYDVTKFLEEHPGGDEVLLTSTAQDASQDFDDVGHSKSAIKMLEQYYVGDLHPDDMSEKARAKLERKQSAEKAAGEGLFGRISKMFW
eukprot:TRINITY_DN399_c0_g1_i3.p1 TRINITY_DN399_c0_g1~~TRINITY_DN399_c0_g1_i3.p1  ORF type:complete len:120 (+),score=19.67 TRINITY_DN399_c0_g1_i3:151-510(+)